MFKLHSLLVDYRYSLLSLGTKSDCNLNIFNRQAWHLSNMYRVPSQHQSCTSKMKRAEYETRLGLIVGVAVVSADTHSR